METDLPVVISERDAAEIAMYCQVAKLNGTTLSVQELLQLTRLDAEEEELAGAWLNSETLSSQYELKHGLIFERSVPRPDGSSAQLAENERERRRRAARNLAFARHFAVLCRSGSAMSISVCGSTSYGSVSPKDDIDFFCVTKKAELWLFLTKSLLLARFFRMTRRGCPQVCLSYVMDEEFAEEKFAGSRDALFARDALTTVVVYGSAFYQRLLREGQWMKTYFPRLYAVRSHQEIAELNADEGRQQHGFHKVASRFLYLTTGNYIRMKSFLLNRRLAKSKKQFSLFRLEIGEDHCIYESARYRWMRRMYGTMSYVNAR